MPGSRTHPLLVIDFLGACAVGACVFAFGWLAMVRGDDVSVEITDLTRVVQAAKQDLATTRSVRDRRRILLTNRRAELASSGRLPDQAPVERYFERLSTLAALHQLRVRSHRPLSPRHYPGLLELRYAYDLSGAVPDITRFLRAVEETEFWADIGFIKLERRPGSPLAGPTECVASLTFSLFSALPVETDSEEG